MQSKTILVWLLITLVSAGCSHLPKIRVLQDPLTAQEHVALGVSYETQGRSDLAISEYKAALKKDPDGIGVAPIIFLGNAHAQRGKFKEASKYYQKTLAQDPQNGQVLNNLAWVYLQQGIKLKEAEAMIRQALDQAPNGDPNRPRYLDTLAEILLAEGRFSEALDLLQEAEALAAQQDDALLLSHIYEHKARAYEALDQPDKATESRQRATDFTPLKK